MFNFDISRDAILVSLTVRQYTGRKKDEILAAQTASANNADSKAVETYLSTLDKEVRLPIQKIGTAARQHLNFNSAMWDEGRRLVANSGYEKLRSELEKHGIEFRAAVEDMLSRHSELELRARTRLGPILFARIGFPTVAALRAAYEFTVSAEPITNPSDIRLRHVSAAAVRDIEERTRGDQNNRVKDALGQLVSRLQTVVGRVADTLKDKDAIFRDTMITNIRELCAVVPALNLTGDPYISRAADEIASTLGSVDPQELRDDPAKREAVAKAAGDLAEKLRTMTPSDDV